MNIILLLLIFIIIICIVLFLLQTNHIELWRYWSLKSTNNIKYYENKYSKISRVKSNRKVVISLTTIPSRINKLKSTLASLMDSTRRVDEIILNIPHKTLKGDKYIIPRWLEKLKWVKIYRIDKDYGPATKLLPTLKREDDKTIIIVVDDDVIYGSKMVEKYVEAFYKRKCRDAITIFGAFITNKLQIKHEPEPTFLRFRGPRYVDLVMGHNSFLVTGEMFGDEVYDFSQALDEARWVDDIWFSCWLSYNGVKIWSLGNVSKVIPITNFEHMNCSTSLCFTENATSHNNDATIKWFYKRKGIRFLCHNKND